MKLVLADTASGYNLAPINNNFNLLEQELQDKVLYRDNPSGEPNQMEQELDMNNYRIYNVADAVAGTDAVNKNQIGAIIEKFGTDFIATAEESFTATAGQSAFNLTRFTYEPGLNNIAVYINGVRQNKIDYIESSQSTVTIVGGVNEGDVVTLISNERQGEINLNELEDYIDTAVDQLFVLEQEVQTATADQTDFTLSSITYIPNTNNLAIYINGVRQVNFTETSSTTVTLGGPLKAGDVVQFLTNKFQETNTSDAEAFAGIALTYKNDAEAAAAKATIDANTASSAASSASASAVSASEDATEAGNFVTQAQTAATEAGTARDAAEDARDLALAARTDAINAADAAEASAAEAAAATQRQPSDTAQTGTLLLGSVWLADTTAPRTRDLPATATEDDEIKIVDNTGTASVNNITIGRNGNTIMGLAEDLTVDTDKAIFSLKYISGDWRIV